MAKSRKKVWEPIETAPAHKEIVVLTDLGEPFLAVRHKKTKFFDVKTISPSGGYDFIPKYLQERNCTYWLNVPNLTKSQFKAKYEMHSAWNKMFER